MQGCRAVARNATAAAAHTLRHAGAWVQSAARTLSPDSMPHTNKSSQGPPSLRCSPRHNVWHSHSTTWRIVGVHWAAWRVARCHANHTRRGLTAAAVGGVLLGGVSQAHFPTGTVEEHAQGKSGTTALSFSGVHTRVSRGNLFSTPMLTATKPPPPPFIFALPQPQPSATHSRPPPCRLARSAVPMWSPPRSP